MLPPTWSDLATVLNCNKGVSASRRLLSGLIVANMGKKGRIWENGRFFRRRQQIRKLGNESSCVTVSLVAIQRKISTVNLH